MRLLLSTLVVILLSPWKKSKRVNDSVRYDGFNHWMLPTSSRPQCGLCNALATNICEKCEVESAQHCETLKHRLNELLMVFNQTQFDYKQRVSRRVRRQLDLACGEHLSSTEVDQMLESKSQEVFYRQVNPISFAGQMALEDATSRHNEILQLEQSIGELNEIFRDMYELVHSQNEVVDHIASNVEAATEFTKNAKIQVTRAVTYKKSAQRKKCIITLISIALLLIVFLVGMMLILHWMPVSRVQQ
uniref:t-SNARE coiled-coil homology domain-containing protein n=1 Tax=Ditylenchus dipsaci TaxID=166011 RepID=A0A915EPW4_9BILA